MSTDPADIKAFQQKAQHAGIDLFDLLKLLGPLEPMLFQSLLEKTKSITVPV